MIYLDNAATTKIEDSAFNAMLPFLKEEYGNASAVYEIARRSKKAVFEARKQCASLIGAGTSEIFFTSGGRNTGRLTGMSRQSSQVFLFPKLIE